MLVLTLIRGASGSGKTTVAKALATVLDIEYVEADMYFIDKEGHYLCRPEEFKEAHNWCKVRTERFLENEQSVIVSNTFGRIFLMEPYIAMAKKHDAMLQIIECHAPFESATGCPDDKTEDMINRYEILPRSIRWENRPSRRLKKASPSEAV